MEREEQELQELRNLQKQRRRTFWESAEGLQLKAEYDADKRELKEAKLAFNKSLSEDDERAVFEIEERMRKKRVARSESQRFPRGHVPEKEPRRPDKFGRTRADRVREARHAKREKLIATIKDRRCPVCNKVVLESRRWVINGSVIMCRLCFSKGVV